MFRVGVAEKVPQVNPTLLSLSSDISLSRAGCRSNGWSEFGPFFKVAEAFDLLE